MAYKFYKLTKKFFTDKFVESFSSYTELDAINDFNRDFDKTISLELKNGKSEIDAIKDYIKNTSVIQPYEDFDLVPEFIEYVISDVVDLENKNIQKAIKETINELFDKKKVRYTRKFAKYAK